MIVIGIAGGIASGKSAVARCLEGLGAVVVDVDQIGHAVLLVDDVKQRAQQRWGKGVIDQQGEIDRKEVAQIVFGEQASQELQFLEDLTFPLITPRLTEKLDELRAAGTRAGVVDAAVMFKAGWDRFCDQIVFVEAEREVRLQRALSRGWSAEMFEARERAQLSPALKRSKSDIIIDNNGSIDQTNLQTERFWLSLDKSLPDRSS